MVAFYPHRSDTPKHLWMDLLVSSQENIDLFANASLFLPEENPEAIEILKEKAASGVRVGSCSAIPITLPWNCAAEKKDFSTPYRDALRWRSHTIVPWLTLTVSSFDCTGRRSTTRYFATIIKCWLISTSTEHTDTLHRFCIFVR